MSTTEKIICTFLVATISFLSALIFEVFLIPLSTRDLAGLVILYSLIAMLPLVCGLLLLTRRFFPKIMRVILLSIWVSWTLLFILESNDSETIATYATVILITSIGIAILWIVALWKRQRPELSGIH
jgi:hypothetical protein